MKRGVLMLAAILMLPFVATSASAQSVNDGARMVRDGVIMMLTETVDGLVWLADLAAEKNGVQATYYNGITEALNEQSYLASERALAARKQVVAAARLKQKAADKFALQEKNQFHCVRSEYFDGDCLKEITSDNGKYLLGVVENIREEVGTLLKTHGSETRDFITNPQNVATDRLAQSYWNLLAIECNPRERDILEMYLRTPITLPGYSHFEIDENITWSWLAWVMETAITDY